MGFACRAGSRCPEMLLLNMCFAGTPLGGRQSALLGYMASRCPSTVGLKEAALSKDSDFREWTGRQLTIIGAILFLLMLAAIGFGSRWTSELWERRSGIELSEQARCSNPEGDCAYKDLPAQVRAATAAEAMVDISIWQLVISTLGLLAVGATLIVNARAVEHSSRQAEVAEKALIASDRPILLALRIDVEPMETDGDTLQFGWLVKNYGSRPAFVTQYAFCIGSVPKGGSPLTDFLPKDVTEAHWPIPPADEWGVKIGDPKNRIRIPKEHRALVLVGEKCLFVAGRVRYTDIGGTKHTHRFAFQYEPGSKRFIPWKGADAWEY